MSTRAVDRLPARADTAILGGGTAGAAVAGLLAERSDESLLVLEAGPDYGPLRAGAWPAELLDARRLASTHQWGYDSGSTYPDRTVPFERTRVVGGCSSHNGCAAIWGHRDDYDGWSAAGNSGWSTEELRPVFEEVERRLRVRRVGAEQVNPFQQACVDAAAAAGVDTVEDLDDLDGGPGMAPFPVNLVDGMRWNTAFASWTPCVSGRTSPSAATRSSTGCCSRTGPSSASWWSGPQANATPCAWTASCSPPAPTSHRRCCCARGVGDPAELRTAGVDTVHELPGVGRNLHDHPAVKLTYAGSALLERDMRRFGERRELFDEQTLAKLRSSRCADTFDIHVYPYNPRDVDGRWSWALPVACMSPRSRGRVWLRSREPDVAPLIDHRYLADDAGHDRAVLADAVRWAREIAAREPLAGLLGAELEPGSGCASDAQLHRFVDAHCAHYYHPVGTCKMGPADDAGAVVDSFGRVHGLDGVYVADASIMPVVPRGNTNVPVVVVAERIAGWLSAGPDAAATSPVPIRQPAT